MRRTVFFIICLLLGCWALHPYLSGATQQPQVTAAQSVAGDLLSTGTANPTTRPDANSQGDEISDYRQVRGHAGFWRLAEDSTGVWWFVSPKNHREFLNTVTTVQPEQEARQRMSPHFVSTDWDGKLGDADLDHWAKATLKRVEAVGFKGLGAWCNPAFHKLDVPMTQDLNLWAWVNDTSKRFYTPAWAEAAEQATKVQVMPLRDNKSLVGYFIDNELDWGDGFSGPGAYFDHLANSDPNRQQVIEVMRSVWPVVSDFNLAWGTTLHDFNEVKEWPSLPRESARAYDRLSTAWLSHLAQDYFRMTTSIIRRYDPNHMVLGVRFKGFAPEEVVAASRNYTDAQSLNYYVGDARLDAEMFRMMYQKSGQPVIISEYSFHAMDGKSGNPDAVGFSAQVPDQQARADGYRLMTTRLARVPYIVGADWFQWSDEPPGGRADGEDVNFGVVDIHDKAYELLADSIRKTTPTLDPLHARSATDSEEDVWRDSYANKPVMQVPYLATVPTFDGNLKNWPQEARLENIRREQTVGLERTSLPSPDTYMGWTQAGLYMAFQVFDKHIETTPASGWWWTRDNIELFISTRPVASDQISYDVNCQQFFIVPEDSTAKNAAVVGQWHRDGDALKDNLIPEPDVKQFVKILPDRYVVELFIPAKALHGFDPVHQPALAFNLHVRDFTTAADFFWSAPKSSRTELRPNTWGTLYLKSPGDVLAKSARASIE